MHWCAILYSWLGVRKCWLSILSNFKQCCVIDSPLANNFHSVKEMNVRDKRKCLQDIKNMKLFSWEEGLLEIGPSQRKGCQLRLTERVLQDILPPSSSNKCLFSLRQKPSVEILIARYRSYFHKKFTGAYTSQTDLLKL